MTKTNKYATEPETLASFLPVDESDVMIVDRSDLEVLASCPWKWFARKNNLVVEQNFLMASGCAAHDCISWVIDDYVSSGGAMGKGEVREQLWAQAMASRPDLQPDVCKALRASMWSIATLIGGLNPANIEAYDGGKDGYSSQLAKEFVFGDDRILATSELDLLLRTPSSEVLEEIDWKSGWKHWTAQMVADSFQFQMHAVLVFEKYPGVQELAIKIWNTRINDFTYRVEFPRTKLDAYTARVREAAELYAQHYHSESPPMWPVKEKCEACEANRICPAVVKAAPSLIDLEAKFNDSLEDRLRTDPAACVDRIHALVDELARWKVVAKSHVVETDEELVGTDGRRFGKKKPKKSPTTFDAYTIKEKK